MNTRNQQSKESKYNHSVFQGRLNLGAVTKPHTSLAIEYPAERIILRTLLALIVVLAFCYLYFVSSSIINIMARKEALSRSAKIDASIGALEGEYFALTQEINPQNAVAIGLSPIANTDYVTRPGTVGMVGTVAINRI